jgi:DNA-binding response OmpR family regulator
MITMEDKKSKILLCEDDTNLGMVLKNYLELNDYDVTLERDGRLVWQLFNVKNLISVFWM